MIIKGLEMPPEEITITIAPNGWVYKVIADKYAVLLDGVTADNDKTILYLCNKKEPKCRCDNKPDHFCKATKNVEYADGFHKDKTFDVYIDDRLAEVET